VTEDHSANVTLGTNQGGRGSAPGDTQLTLGWYTTPVPNLGDRTKNAGGYSHRTTSVLYGKAFAY